MEIINGNESEFNNLVSNGIVLVDFYATWCGPCKMLAPVLEEVASDRDELKVVKMDIDENMELAKTYGVMSVPTLMLFKDGNMLANRQPGPQLIGLPTSPSSGSTTLFFSFSGFGIGMALKSAFV